MTKIGQFSEREKEVVELLLQGKSNKQIALALGISDRTVEFHLNNVYTKLQVSSRAEAIVKLGKSTRDEHAKSAVVKINGIAENDGKSIPNRRFPMKNFLYIIGAGLLTTILVIALLLTNAPTEKIEISPSPTIGITQTPVTPTPTPIPQPTVSSREHVLTQIRQLAAEYDQAVQAEKKTGRVELSKDPVTGEEIFLFKDESYTRMQDLSERFWEKINQLDAVYVQIYRDELQPTPYPTQATTEQNKAFYENLISQGQDFCPRNIVEKSTITIPIYRPDDGKYVPGAFGDDYARCEVWGQMVEEFRIAPMLAKINKAADMVLIRQITGKPELTLTFQTITSPANAIGHSAALYKDETGSKYYIDVETARLTQIEPNFPTHPDIPANETKNLDELRGIAEQFALTNSPRLKDLKPDLVYEEGGKGNFYFFTWSYRNKDWSGTDWAMMPPFIQVGVLANGQIATYINTLDLFE